MTAIEPCVDVAQHVCSSEGWGPPADNSDAMLQFRKVLVHEDVQVIDAIVLDRLRQPGALEQFAQQVADWLASQR